MFEKPGEATHLHELHLRLQLLRGLGEEGDRSSLKRLLKSAQGEGPVQGQVAADPPQITCPPEVSIIFLMRS